MAILVLTIVVVLPLVALGVGFRWLGKGRRMRLLLAEWARGLEEALPGSTWKLEQGDLRTSLPRLKGKVGQRALALEPRRLSRSRIDVGIRFDLAARAAADLSVAPESTGTRITSLFAREPKIGDPAFDEGFHIVSTANEGVLRTMVQFWLRESLMQFRQDRGSFVLVHASGPTLEFEERNGPCDLDGYPDLIEGLCDLADLLESRLQVDEEGAFVFELIASGEAGADEVKCPICGDPIGQIRVECVACGTPQHPECWEYSGQCAVYACGCRECRHRP